MSSDTIDKNKLIKNTKRKKLFPKITPEILMGDKGIKSLLADFSFDDFKKYSNVEVKIEGLIRLYTRWIDSIFPDIKFEDALSDIEKLGKNREVKNFMKQLRKSFCEKGFEALNNEVEDTKNTFEMELSESDNDIEENVDKIKKRKISEENNDKECLDDKQKIEDKEAAKKTREEEVESAMKNIGLTDEQRERIRINRERALKLRAEKRKNELKKRNEAIK